jgi:Fe-Mn family superoxide dismutase
MNKPNMSKIEEKIQQLETQIVEQKISREKKLLITEMKKIGIEKLPYSYSSLKQFIDSETMDIHYNKHYKGYVDKLNDALSKKKYGDVELEQIIKTISRFDKTIRNNAGGAFNHALFWKMLSPEPTKLKGDLQKKIIKEFGSFASFKKEFGTVAKDRFGSGWVWLVLTSKNTLKIMSTPNQDNPLMNIIDGGGFPILGLDVWEHAYYLKYQNKRDEYISNFWKVVNWDFVTKLYEMKTETKITESTKMKLIIQESKEPQFCNSKETQDYRELINNFKIKKVYQDGVTEVLKDVFHEYWVEGTNKEMSGFYGIESESARSILNNLNTNFNTFCLLTKAINKQIDLINKPQKKFDFSQKEKRTLNEVNRLINALRYFKKEIFTKNNEDFVNIINVLTTLWNRGQKSEDKVLSKIESYFGKNSSVEKIGGHGQKSDAIKGIDLIVNVGDKKYTSQVKPYSTFKQDGDKIIVFDTGNVKPYNVDWMIFINTKSNKIIIFKNNPIQDQNQYVFDVSSLIHQID